MARVTRTDLNQQTARVLARVAEGERLTITDRGRPVAEIVPPAKTARESLVAAGRLSLPSAHGALPFEPVPSEVSSRETLAELRADRG